MIYGLYAIKDAKTTYMPIQCDYNDASAIRNFEHAVNDPKSLMCTHPNDYALFRVGTFDNVTGETVPEWPVVLLTDAASVLRKE